MHLEAEMMVSEWMSRGVAMAVTQPVCPSKVPRRANVSDILPPDH